MPNPTGSASAVTRLPRKPKARGQTEVHYLLTVQYADGSGQIVCRTDPGMISTDLAAGTGELLATIFSRLLHGLPQADQVSAR